MSSATICNAEIHWYEVHGIVKKELKFNNALFGQDAIASRHKRGRAGHPLFAICVRNKDYEASLKLRKLYPVLEDDFGAQHGMIRVIDESGKDYLFPNEYFGAVSSPDR